MATQKHRLYFSTKCRHCQAFMEELIRTPFVREVAAICVDPSPTRPSLPPWLKSVPTLVVIGESSPRVGPGAVNNWLFERRMGGSGATTVRNTVTDDRRIPVYTADTSQVGPVSRSDMSVSNNGRLPSAISGTTEGDKSAGPPTLAGSLDDEKVKPYFNLEMSGKSWSDIYSFLAQKAEESTKAYNPIVRNFELLTEALGISSGAATASATRVSEKEAALLREFEAYTAGRDRDIKGPISRK